MSLSNSKCRYSNNCLNFLKHPVSLVIVHLQSSIVLRLWIEVGRMLRNSENKAFIVECHSKLMKSS